MEGGRSEAGLDDLRQQTCACKDFSLDMALAWLFTLLPVSGKLPDSCDGHIKTRHVGVP